MVECLVKEIKLTPFPSQGMNTIYFGGGTPSLLKKPHLKLIFDALTQASSLADVTEITLECNPEDINEQMLIDWESLGINRLSIGLQSLQNEELISMNRAHSADQSFEALNLMTKYPHFDVSVDLIYGTPWKSNAQWELELQTLLNHPTVKHLSAYALTTEPKTVLYHQVKNGDLHEANDQKVIDQFEILQRLVEINAWDAYEISNYCKPNYRAVHNGNYWKYLPYYGIGPSAHSFDGSSTRYINEANNARYMDLIDQKILPRQYEKLDLHSMLNERLMTGLRTQEGIQIDTLTHLHPSWRIENEKTILRYQSQGLIVRKDNHIQLTKEGKLLSDMIISSLMIV